ncbi:unnamed protein product [Sphagnum troendelagicum]|uniref:Transposase n=1 Tax=Sphagnum troendelagicum TaxID=128251 RepID=A0ABP0TWM1_9BRYO
MGHVERFVNVSWGKKDALAVIKASDASSEEKRAQGNALCAHLRKIKTDLLSPGEKLTFEEMYHDWIEAQHAHVMLCRKLNKGVYYNIQCSSQDYLRPMLYMMRVVKKAGAKDTRCKDTYVKKHHDYLQMRKHEVIDGKRVVEWEVELSAYNKKTTDFAAFETFLMKKNEMNVRFALFYQDYTFRRMKMMSFIGRELTEAKMIREFKEKFGSSEEVVVAIKDWEQRPHRKFKESTKGKGFRTLLRKASYDMYLVDKFRTSCRCSHCKEHGECKTVLECENPRPYRTGRILRHGLVRYKMPCSREIMTSLPPTPGLEWEIGLV